MKKFFLLICLVLAGLSFGQSAYALALAEIQVNSSLNQQLDAVIPLDSATAQDLDNLNVSVSRTSNDADSAYKWPHIEVKLVRSESGKSYLKLTSQDNVREPILRFMVEVQWATGRIQREYSLLMNPQF